MKKHIITTDLAPAAIGPYSQAVIAENFLYTSGQIALDPLTGKFLGGEIKQETERTIQNILAILQAGGLKIDDVIKVTVYLTDLNDFTQMNEVYEKYFSNNKPARACVQVAGLPKGAKVEMDAVAIGSS